MGILLLKIENATIFLLRLPLSQPYNHHGLSRNSTDNIVLRLRCEGLEGYGESVPRSYVTGETAQSAFRTLREALVPSLGGRNFDSPEAVKTFLHGMMGSSLCQRNLAAYCALDLALLYDMHRLIALQRPLGGTERAKP